MLLVLLGPQGAGFCHLVDGEGGNVASDHQDGHSHGEGSEICEEVFFLIQANRDGVAPSTASFVGADGADACWVEPLPSLFLSTVGMRLSVPVVSGPIARSPMSPAALCRFLL